mgnify:CR=1 FL=1
MIKDILYELQNLTYLNWAKTRHSSGTAGTLLKSYDDTGKTKKYYKLSSYDPVRGIFGHECINEIIVQRLMDILGFEHLKYKLIHSTVSINDIEYETYLCESEDFKNKDESKLAIEDFYAMEKKPGETPWDFCIRFGWADYIYRMLVIDYLVLNRDRHGANMEVLKSRNNKSLRLAPLFDHGLSLACSCYTLNELESFDVMSDKKVQCFIGSNSTFDNVKKVPKDFIKGLPMIHAEDKGYILEGLDNILGREYLNKIWEMICLRSRQLGNI